MSPTGMIAIVPAGGSGSRARLNRPKQFLEIGGRPLIVHTVARLVASGRIFHTIAAVPSDWIGYAADAFPVAGLDRVTVVTGGPSRHASVAACLERLPEGAERLPLLVHDAARPFLEPAEVGRLAEALTDPGCDAAGLFSPVVDTVYATTADGLLPGPGRDGLLLAETPQIFRPGVLQACHRRAAAENRTFPDDLQLAKAYGHQTRPVFSGGFNRKVTSAGDVDLAMRLLADSRPREVRVGLGTDVHRLAPGRPMVLGGVAIPSEVGPEGWSDGDAALHAVCDALLGALAAGDIGDHFPPGDERFRGIDSRRLLAACTDLARTRGFVPLQTAVVIELERPRLAPYREAMRAAIADGLGIEPDRVGLTATTHEGLGPVGRGEMVRVQCIIQIGRE